MVRFWVSIKADEEDYIYVLIWIIINITFSCIFCNQCLKYVVIFISFVIWVFHVYSSNISVIKMPTEFGLLWSSFSLFASNSHPSRTVQCLCSTICFVLVMHLSIHSFSLSLMWLVLTIYAPFRTLLSVAEILFF